MVLMDAIVLAGGRSSRLGRPKEDVVVRGRPLLETTVDACAHAGVTIVVGPWRERLVPAGVLQVQERPEKGGPAAGIAAALPVLTASLDPFVVVVACDMPLVTELIPLLTPPADDFEAVVARDRGRAQPLAAIYHRAALERAIGRERVTGRSMKSVLDDLVVMHLDVPDGTTDDVDTPADQERWQGRDPH